MSDSNRIGSFSIAELNTQYNNVTDLDAIESRTFDADSDGTVRGFTDFSNTINTMDENHWMQIDSDGSGNNMLGYELDFAPEKPGTPNPPIYNIADNLQAQSSVVNGLSERLISGTGAAICGISTVAGISEHVIIGFGILEDALSTVASTAERIITGTGTLVTGSSTCQGAGVRGSNSISADLVDGNSKVDGSNFPPGVAFGILKAQPSTVEGIAPHSVPYVGMPSPAIYVGMPDGKNYVANVIQPE